MVDLIHELIGEEEAHHLWMFLPRSREQEADLEFLELTDREYVDSDQFSHTITEAVGVYQSAWSIGRSPYMRLDSFMRGASAVSVLLTEESRNILQQLLQVAGDTVEAQDRYPALVEQFIVPSVGVACAVLTNGEGTTREELLAYNHGVWWVMGHVKGVEEASVRGEEEQWQLAEWVGRVLAKRAELGVLE